MVLFHSCVLQAVYQQQFICRRKALIYKEINDLDTKSKGMGWLMGLEPTTTGITILDSTN